MLKERGFQALDIRDLQDEVELQVLYAPDKMTIVQKDLEELLLIPMLPGASDYRDGIRASQ